MAPADDLHRHDFTALARAAAARHGFPPDAEAIPFSLTENPTYRIAAPGREPLALRIYRPAGRPAVEIESELAWLTALREEAGLPVPATPPALDGSVVIELGEPRAPVYAVAFELIAGRECGDDDLPALMPRLGELTARLHVHARSWTPPAWFTRPRWDLATTLGDTPHWGTWRNHVTDADERRQLERLDAVLVRRLTAFGTGPQRFGLTHADLRTTNVLVDGETFSIIDFDDAGFTWYLYDLGATFTVQEGRPDADELIAAWVEGYRRVAPLPAEDADEIWTFLMLRRLLVSAFASLRSDTELAAELAAIGYTAESCRIAETYLSRFG